MKGKDNIWKSLGYPDMDFDGDVDEMDAFLFDELLESSTETHSSILDDEDDEDDDFNLDDTDETGDFDFDDFDADDNDDF